MEGGEIKNLFLLPIVIVLSSISGYSQLTGSVNGTLGPGTYTVIGDIWVQYGDSLTILPGTDMLFNGLYGFDVDGYLYAVGTESDSIRFMKNTGIASWAGIAFDSTSSDSCRLKYCVITGSQSYGDFPDNGGGGILVYHSNPIIENCSISYNKAEWGGGIYYYQSASSILRNCTISHDSSDWGGGIGMDFSNALIENCTIEHNWTNDDGGGIACYESSPNISNCTIRDNRAIGSDIYPTGGGLCFYSNSNAHISNCTISGNLAEWGGGGIACCYSSESSIVNCTVQANSSQWGGGFNCYYASPSIQETLIGSNSAVDGGGLHLNNSNATISNCTITGSFASNAGGGILLTDASPIIESCEIGWDTADVCGGGIGCYDDANPVIESCEIDYNIADSGGGMDFAGANATISNCHISGNHADYGSCGIDLTDSSPDLLNCEISWNTNTEGGGGGMNCYDNSDPNVISCIFNANSAQWGGGINCYYASPTIQKTLFSWNSAEAGGGINLDHSNATIANCTFTSNSATISGGGIDLSYSNASIKNTIVSGNLTSGGMGFHNSLITSVTYCDFYNNGGGNFLGELPPGLGTITTYNANSDPCDQYYNILLNPQFVGGGDYHLTEDSPSIDAGDPLSPQDPDGTVADIGAYYYDQAPPLIGLSNDELDFELVLTGHSLDLPLQIYSLSSHVLTVRSIYTTNPCFYTDFDPSDSLVAGGDSLELSVTFAPSSQILYHDTLFIISDCETDTVMVSLLGDSRAIPDTVRNLTIQIDYPHAILNWDRVTQTVYGTPVSIDYYLVYYEGEYNEEFNFLAVAMDTTYSHEYVAQFASSMFYFVEAYVGGLEGLDQLLASALGMTRAQVHELLSREASNQRIR
jgi:parallel beta-helix repeat protein